MPRILHISDVHFGPHHLPELAAAVLDLAATHRPDAVLLSGDLTQRAKPQQFGQAREFVDAFDVPTLAVPGNHDVPLYRFWERFLSPYGAYRRHFAAELEPVLATDGLFVVGVNSAHGLTLTDGRVCLARLARLAEQFAGAPVRSCKVVVIHHPMVPPPLLELPRAIDNAREAADVLVGAGVELVLSGHIHQTYLSTLGSFYGVGLPEVRVVHTGTTTSDRGRYQEAGRNTLNWIEIDDRVLEVRPHMWSPEERRFVERSRHRFARRATALDDVSAPDSERRKEET